MRWLARLAAVVAGTAAIAPAAAAAAAASTVTVDLSRPSGTVNKGLIGFVYHPGTVPLSSVGALHPRFVRIDASLQDVSPAPGVLRVDGLLHTVADVRAIGAEPLVILSYVPAWLGGPLPGPDRTRNPPSDLSRWRALVQAVVMRLATARAAAYWFEAWNEPDLPTYWTGTPTQWGDLASASGEAVQAAARATGKPLRFGGPASFIPDPLYETEFAERMRSDGVPVGFVSWHYYANYPCIGPDGPESPGAEGELLSLLLSCRNPDGTPDWFARGAAVARTDAEAVLGAVPPLMLDEWNLSAGGLDRRMDTYVGAAFDAASLVALQGSGVDDAMFYQATDTDPRPGGWGVVGFDGRRKPAWWTFDLWRRMQRVQVPVSGADPGGGLWAIASRSPSGLPATVLLANYRAFDPAPLTIDLALAGLRRGGAVRATVRRIDATHPAAVAAPVALRGGRIVLSLPAQSVALVAVDRARR